VIQRLTPNGNLSLGRKKAIRRKGTYLSILKRKSWNRKKLLPIFPYILPATFKKGKTRSRHPPHKFLVVQKLNGQHETGVGAERILHNF